MDERMKIINKITSITDGDGNIVPIEKIEIEFSNNKYASKKLAVWRILVNGKRITKADKYKYEYRCVTCDSKHSLCSISLIRKVNKCSYECVECCNLNPIKRANHSNNFHSYPAFNKSVEPVEEIKPLTYIQKRDLCLAKFNAMDDEYKTGYFAFHLTQDDFKRLSKNIVGFENGKIEYKAEEIEYWPVYNSTNQMTFTHMMYNKKTETIFKPNQPMLKCDNCDSVWRAKSIERFKNCYKIFCKTCTFVNKTFILRKTQNSINETIMYQSKLELKFINWCNNNGIVVKNGPIVPYTFNSKERTYRIDFNIADLLIEIKDNHCWHKDDLQTGKWQAKETAARQLITDGKYSDYIMITPRDWIASLSSLKQRLTTTNTTTNTNITMAK